MSRLLRIDLRRCLVSLRIVWPQSKRCHRTDCCNRNSFQITVQCTPPSSGTRTKGREHSTSSPSQKTTRSDWETTTQPTTTIPSTTPCTQTSTSKYMRNRLHHFRSKSKVCTMSGAATSSNSGTCSAFFSLKTKHFVHKSDWKTKISKDGRNSFKRKKTTWTIRIKAKCLNWEGSWRCRNSKAKRLRDRKRGMRSSLNRLNSRWLNIMSSWKKSFCEVSNWSLRWRRSWRARQERAKCK